MYENASLRNFFFTFFVTVNDFVEEFFDSFQKIKKIIRSLKKSTGLKNFHSHHHHQHQHQLQRHRHYPKKAKKKKRKKFTMPTKKKKKTFNFFQNVDFRITIVSIDTQNLKSSPPPPQKKKLNDLC